MSTRSKMKSIGETVEEYTAGYGLPMDGLIGLGQWMFSLVNGTLEYPVELPENPTAQDQKDYEAAIAEWESLSLDGLKHYDLDEPEYDRICAELKARRAASEAEAGKE